MLSFLSNVWRIGFVAALLAAAGCRPFEATPGQPVGACCEGAGACLPAEFVAPEQRGRLSATECAAPYLCVPHELRAARAPAQCHTSSNGEGRCLPACLPSVAAQLERLALDGCQAHQRCVPCYDPLSGEFTGACSGPNDPGPVETAHVFGYCCNNLGRCVPSQLVPAAQRGDVARDACQDAAELCVPSGMLDAQPFVPASCSTGDLKLEGRCLPACLPELVAQADRLAQDGCAAGQVCAPCFDPFTGAATASCKLGADPGPARPPVVFEHCCGDLGRCLPAAAVPQTQRAQLGRDQCTDSAALCVPEALAKDSKYAPPSCQVASWGAEGRCLPACLPELAAQADRLAQDGCAAGQVCAPCFDPFTGAATASCKLGADPGPVRPAVVFEHCCNHVGRCLPAAAVPEAQRSQLGSDGCTDSAALCVPEALARDSKYTPAMCEVTSFSAEGRCLPDCLPLVAASGDRLERESCREHERCAPCYDPLHGEPTGACALGADPGASRGPALLGTCCEGLGRCAPRRSVPQSLVDQLARDACDDAQLCVAPSALLEAEPAPPAQCHDPNTSAEGRCLPRCLPQVSERADTLARADCPEQFLCVPCFDPRDGASTGACSQAGDRGPSEPAVVFQACCGDAAGSRGLCVPQALIPAGSPELPPDTCRDPGYVCAPTRLIDEPDAKFAACSSALSGPGVCVDACFLADVSLSSLLSQATCDAGQRCVPCAYLTPGALGCETD